MRKYLESLEDGVARVLSDYKPHTVAEICKTVRYDCKKVGKLLFAWREEGSVIMTGGRQGEPFFFQLNSNEDPL